MIALMAQIKTQMKTLIKIFFLFVVITGMLPAQDSTLINFIGDSHTEGSGTMGYRDRVIHLLDSLGYVFKNVGNRRTNYITPNPVYGNTTAFAHSFHSGINGISAATYRPLIKDTLNVNLHGEANNIPDVAIVWLGANDIANGSYSTTTIRNNIGGLLDSMWVVDENIRVVLVNLTLFQRAVAYTQAKEDSIEGVNALLPAMVAEKIAAGRYCVLVDMYSVTVDSNLTQSDGIHFTNGANYSVVGPTILPYVRTAIDSVLVPAFSPRTGGYVVSWELNMTGISGGAGAANYGNMPYSALPFSALSDLFLFSTNLDTNGNMNVNSIWDGKLSWGGTNLLYQRRAPFIQYARANGAERVLLTVFGVGQNGNWTKMVNSADHRTQAVRTLLDSCIIDNGKSLMVDGLDFDIEPFDAVDTNGTRLFLAELYDSLQNYRQVFDTSKTPIITAPAVMGTASIPFWKSVEIYLDWITVQTYDLFGTWTTRTWHNNPIYTAGATDTLGTPLSSVQRKMRQLLDSGMTASKLGLGLANNAYRWRGGLLKGSSTQAPINILDEWQTAPTKITSTNPYPYYRFLRDYIERYPDSVAYDAQRFTSTMHLDYAGASTDTFLTFQDSTTVYEGVLVTDTLNLGGLFLWNIPEGYLGATNYPSVTERNPFVSWMQRAIGSTQGNEVIASAAHSTLSPSSASVAADEDQVLIVTARDVFGQRIFTGGETVTITRVSGLGTVGTVTDNGDGTYTAVVSAPYLGGSGVFSATLGGEAVANGATLTFTVNRLTKHVRVRK
jgi:GH18 family chitinase/lysophospholipase L1-like esterase